MDIPVEDFNRHDRVILLGGRAVVVEAIEMNDGLITVRWRGGQKLTPPARNAGEFEHLGSFKPCRPGETVSVQELVARG